MDELDGVLSDCPRCLQRREVAGTGEDLYWTCGCGKSPIDLSLVLVIERGTSRAVR